MACAARTRQTVLLSAPVATTLAACIRKVGTIKGSSMGRDVIRRFSFMVGAIAWLGAATPSAGTETARGSSITRSGVPISH